MQQRIAQIRRFLQQNKYDGFLIAFVPHIRYLTGFSGSSAMLLILRRSIHFFTDGRYATQVQKELKSLPGLRIHIARDVPAYLAKHALISPGKTIAFEAHTISYYTYRQFRKALPTVRWRGHTGVIEPLIAAKTEQEIRAIRKAVRIADRVYQEMLGFIQPGMREIEVAAEISYRARRYGSEGDAFDIIVASGKRSALPHGRASTKKIRSGEIVTMDFGCIVGGFCSDITRTVAVGKASKRAQQIYGIVYRAYQAAIECLKSGVQASDVDAAARQVIADAGYADYFPHSLGHGVGISVHEYPTLSPRGNEQEVVKNTVVTIEPGIYLPNAFGIRVEDDVVVREKDAQPLAKVPPELVVIE